MADYREDGGQVDYETTTQINNNNTNNAGSLLTTSDEVYYKREREAKIAQMEALLEIAGLGGAAYGTALLVNKNPELAEFLAKVPGANRYSIKHDIARNEAIRNLANPVNLTNLYEKQSFGRSILSMLLSVEELSPFGILKTLQLSNLIEPMVGIARDSNDIKFTGSALAASEEYYDALIRKASGGKHSLLGDDLQYGMTIRNNKLYRNFADGSVDDSKVIVNYVRPVTTHVKMGDSQSPNRPLLKLAEGLGVNLGFNTFNKEQTAFIGSNSAFGLARDWVKAALNQSLEVGYKTMDNPLGGVEDLLKGGGLSATGVFESKAYLKVKSLLNVQFGTAGDYTQGLVGNAKNFATNLAKKSAAIYLGYQGINEVLNWVTPDSSVWNDGIINGLTANYANVRVGLAKVLADPFQRYKQAQEDAADGSTNLMTLIGFPTAGAVLGGSLPYYKRLADSATKGMEAASALSDAKTSTFGLLEPLTKRLGLGATQSYKATALKGAALGALVALPFLPGALIGTSSSELKDQYSGKELVANRDAAHWLAGGNAWEGGHIKNYQASRVARILSGAKDEVMYGGDDNLKRDLDPFFSPFNYLKNPYAFEEMHQNDMPYPVWGMNVDFGSFLGKAYQGTIGEIIKPTVVNEKFLEDSQLLAKGALEDFRNNVFSATGIVTSSPKFSSGDIGGFISNKLNSITPTYTGFDKKDDDQLGTYPIAFTANYREKQMIESGMMLREESPEINPYKIAASQTYSALTDFAGLKGFTSSLVANKLGYDPETTRLQLARSGTANSLADTIKDENVGDLFGLGEFQRRLIPTSAGSKQNDINPMLNSVSPSWLPHNEEKYFNDFSKGNFWDKVSLGEERLPGVGYAALNENLKGINPEDYPLVHQYKILSDVATGSPEQIAMKEYLLKAEQEGKLTDKEKDIFYNTLTQEQAKSRRKDFSEYKTPEELSRMSLGGRVLNTIWETAAHNVESPLEPLTPFRPGAKFVHKRTAIEDYEKTMLAGPDTGIWTNPYSHFIRPTLNRVKDVLLPGYSKPIEAVERDNVDEYFDKLEYLKARKTGRVNDALRTVHGASYAGITDVSSYNKFRSGLSDGQKDYLEAFSKETDSSKRNKILELLPTDVGRAYIDIWNNLGVAEQAKRSGGDVKNAVDNQYLRDTVKYVPKGALSTKYARDMDTAIQEEKVAKAIQGKDWSDKDNLLAQAKEMRLRAADAAAEQYVASVTGVPDDEWLGWDPRLNLDEVKLRTLQIGHADTYEYGYWDSDVQRNSRIIALDDEDFITEEYNTIKKGMRSTLFKKIEIEKSLMSNGLIPKRVVMSEASRSDLDIRIDNE